MADDPGTGARWLPPQAPGAQPPPRFDPAPEPEPEPPPQQLPPPPAAEQPVFVPARRPSQGTNTLAVAALVLGIAGIALLVLSLGLGFIFALPCSIGAWLCGAQARARIGAGETQAGSGQAQAGYILGIVGVVLGIGAMVAWIALIASGFSVEDFRDDLERELDRQRNRDEVDARLLELRAAAAALLAR
jgi:hypothetical protein